MTFRLLRRVPRELSKMAGAFAEPRAVMTPVLTPLDPFMFITMTPPLWLRVRDTRLIVPPKPLLSWDRMLCSLLTLTLKMDPVCAKRPTFVGDDVRRC